MSKLPMNLPNQITIARILMIPLYLVLMVIGSEVCIWLAAIVFAIAALTDMLDGRLARSRNEVTDFGKFMDPIADKLLVLIPLIYLMSIGNPVSVWAVMLMVAREIVVSGFRLVAVRKGSVIAAGPSGKLKTFIQMVAVFLITLNIDIGYYIAWIATVISVYSGAEIIIKNRAVLAETSDS